MTTNEFVQLILTNNPGMIQDDVRKIVRLVFSSVKEAIRTGESVLIPGVGTLYLQFKRGRKDWRNPFNGEIGELQSKIKLKFRANKAMQSYLTENMTDMFEAIEDDDFDMMGLDEEESLRI